MPEELQAHLTNQQHPHLSNWNNIMLSRFVVTFNLRFVVNCSQISVIDKQQTNVPLNNNVIICALAYDRYMANSTAWGFWCPSVL